MTSERPQIDRARRRTWRLRALAFLAVALLVPPLLVIVSLWIGPTTDDVMLALAVAAGAAGGFGGVAEIVLGIVALRARPRPAYGAELVAAIVVGVLALPWAGLCALGALMVHLRL